MISITEYTEFDNIDAVVGLFAEYIKELEIDPSFQDFETELSDLKKLYSPEAGGCLIIASEESEMIGCVALKKLSESICEMKRLYVKPEYRSKKVGICLVNRVIEKALSKGYYRMRLDVLEKSRRAIELYRSLGFREIESYCYNPYPTIWMELDLRNFECQKK